MSAAFAAFEASLALSAAFVAFEASLTASTASSAFSSFLNLPALAIGKKLLAISTANSAPAAQRFASSPVSGSFPVTKRSPLFQPMNSAAKVGSLALFSWLNFANFTLYIPHESLGEPLDTPPMSFYQFALSDPV